MTNAAVGAPVTKGKGEEEIDYFANASTVGNGEGYFPPVSQPGSSLAYEILHDEHESVNGSGERQPISGPSTEYGTDRGDASTNSDSSGRNSANERNGGPAIDGIIGRLHGSTYISLSRSGGIPPSEEQQLGRDHRGFSSPQLRPPPTCRKRLDPSQEQRKRNHNLSFPELVQDAGSQSS